MDLLSLLLFSILASSVYSFKILVLYPLPSGSHNILGNGLIKHLLDAGHQVTYVTPFVEREPLPNLRVIDVSANMKLFDSKGLDVKAIMSKEINMQEDDFIMSLMIAVGNGTLENKNVQKLLRDPNERFDLVILEWMFTQVTASIVPVFGCPYIWISSLEPHWIMTSLVDDRLHPAYNPDYKTNIIPPFTFTQRVHQLWTQIAGEFDRTFKYFVRENEIYKRVIAPILTARGTEVPEYLDLIYNASLILSNSHVSMGLPTKVPQNYISIGGYHIESQVKPLPKDLQVIIDGAKAGVIYFSMGSNLRSTDLPEELKTSLLKMFGALKQTVIWKFEEELPNLPKNVHILKWAPQQSILAHPNVVLFITHGGLLSTTEALHYGVPIIGIPVFADQFSNIGRAVAKGFARKVDLSITMTEELKEAIDDLVTDNKYKIKVKELSFIYHHRPVPPGKELVHWVEHVVRTRGAPHLRSPALMVPWYQKLYLDLIALVVLLLTIVVLGLKRFLSRSKLNVDKTKKKK